MEGEPKRPHESSLPAPDPWVQRMGTDLAGSQPSPRPASRSRCSLRAPRSWAPNSGPETRSTRPVGARYARIAPATSALYRDNAVLPAFPHPYPKRRLAILVDDDVGHVQPRGLGDAQASAEQHGPLSGRERVRGGKLRPGAKRVDTPSAGNRRVQRQPSHSLQVAGAGAPEALSAAWQGKRHVPRPGRAASRAPAQAGRPKAVKLGDEGGMRSSILGSRFDSHLSEARDMLIR